MTGSLQRLWRDWRGFLLFIGVMLLFRSAIADWNQVPSGSMLPSILVGDRIVVDKLAYDLRVPFTLHRLAHWKEPARGEVVTFPSPEDERLLVKRIVGIPGDVVTLRDNQLIINDHTASYEPMAEGELVDLDITQTRDHEFLRESILGSERTVMLHSDPYHNPASSFGPIRVPAGHYLMMGDNRDNSRDSRSIGFVSRERILGRAETVAFSLDYENYYAPRLDRFLAKLP